MTELGRLFQSLIAVNAKVVGAKDSDLGKRKLKLLPRVLWEWVSEGELSFLARLSSALANFSQGRMRRAGGWRMR